MLGKDVFWEHSVSGLSVTNPRPPAGRGCPTPHRLSGRVVGCALLGRCEATDPGGSSFAGKSRLRFWDLEVARLVGPYVGPGDEEHSAQWCRVCEVGLSPVSQVGMSPSPFWQEIHAPSPLSVGCPLPWARSG